MSFLQQTPPSGIRIAQLIGVTVSTSLFAGNIVISTFAIPAIMKSPAPLAARQFVDLYNLGVSTAPPLAVLVASTLGYVAYNQDPSSTVFKLNIAAIVLNLAIMPFTLAVIFPIVHKLKAKKEKLAGAALEDKAVEAGVVKEETTNALLDKWAWLNLARAALSGAGALCALWAATSGLESFVAQAALKSGANRLG